MRKLTSMILIILFATALIFTFTACTTEPSNENGSSQPGESSTPDTPAAPDDNNDDDNDDLIVPSVEMPVGKEAGKLALFELGADDPSRSIVSGFRIRACLDTGSEVTAIEFGGSDAIYWIGTAADNDSWYSATYEFFKEKDEKTWITRYSSWMELPGQPLISSVFGDLADELLYGAYDEGFQANMEFVGKTTLGGRACSLYSTSITYNEQTQTVRFWVDDTYGITLKMEYEGVDSVEFTIDLKLDGLDEITELPGQYEGIHNGVSYDTYIHSENSLADFAYTWNAPNGIGKGTLTIAANGAATLDQTTETYTGSVTVNGYAFVFSATGTNDTNKSVSCSGLIAFPESDKTQFTLKDASYSYGVSSSSGGASLTFNRADPQ